MKYEPGFSLSKIERVHQALGLGVQRKVNAQHVARAATSCGDLARVCIGTA